MERINTLVSRKCLIIVSRSWRKEADCIDVTSLDSFLNCTQDRIHNREHRVMLNWAQGWNPSTRERVLLPVRAQEGGKYLLLRERGFAAFYFLVCSGFMPPLLLI